MSEHLPLLVLLIGTLIALSILTKSALEHLHLPPLIGYLILGLAVRVLNDSVMPLGQMGHEVLEFLAKIGIVVLLFRVGLESNLRELISQLRCASFIWLCNIPASAAAGYLAGRLLGLDTVGSVLVAVAMTATSVGIPSRIWHEARAINSTNGERFLDVAELDDISGVIFLGLLFAILPAIRGQGDLVKVTLWEAGLFGAKLIGFVLFCMVFSLVAEKRITAFCRKIESAPDPMLVVAGIGFIIAALAGVLGFSLAIGAFFAGLAFSRDPERVKLEASFTSLYELFTPFFFIGIGLALAPSSLAAGLVIGAILLPAAIVGKIVGTTLPARLYTGWLGAAALGLSMIPRAEITMIIMQKGLARGIVDKSLYSGMVLVSAVTCVVGPVLLRWMLQKHKEGVTQ